MQQEIKILNWNVGGSKYLSKPGWNCGDPEPEDLRPGEKITNREEYKFALMRALRGLIADNDPDVVTLQEIVRYSPDGDPENPQELLDKIDGYKYLAFPLIDTEQFSARPKWLRVMSNGGWPSPPAPEPFFAQGNGFLIKDKCPHYPVWSLPKAHIDHNEYPVNIGRNEEHKIRIERVDLQTGLYFGDRSTEPRVALVLHLVLSPNDKPLDVFVVNLHLTTLREERVGIPEIDEKASLERLEQLKVVLDGIISRYNRWRNDGYRIGNREAATNPDWDTRLPKERHNPIWVIAGDFNFTRESAEYDYLTRRNFMDLIPNGGPTKSSGVGQPPTVPLDYVFAGPRFYSFDPRLAELELGPNAVIFNPAVSVSDHYPMVARVPIVV